MNVTIIMFLH